MIRVHRKLESNEYSEDANCEYSLNSCVTKSIPVSIICKYDTIFNVLISFQWTQFIQKSRVLFIVYEHNSYEDANYEHWLWTKSNGRSLMTNENNENLFPSSKTVIMICKYLLIQWSLWKHVLLWAKFIGCISWRHKLWMRFEFSSD